MKRGILVFDRWMDQWMLWLGQRRFELHNGHDFELRILSRYYLAQLFYQSHWHVTLNTDTTFILSEDEVYKVRLDPTQYHQIQQPPF
jgi:uncharacterized membrane protein